MCAHERIHHYMSNSEKKRFSDTARGSCKPQDISQNYRKQVTRQLQAICNVRPNMQWNIYNGVHDSSRE